MKNQIERVDGRVPIVVLRVEGDIDASNYEELIDEGRRLYDEGARDLLLDLRAVPFMGSSGLVALHSIVLLFNGQETPDLESGWSAHHALERSIDAGIQPHVKVLISAEPDAALRRVLERTGMDRFIDVRTDEAEAIAAF